jgi:hypothetical protein
MVSSCLLPPSSTEKARIYPDHATSGPGVAGARTGVPEQPDAQQETQQPPVPDYWNHEARQREASASIGVGYDTSPLYTPNSSHLAFPRY